MNKRDRKLRADVFDVPANAGKAQVIFDLWPLWRATEGLPVALIRGANSDLLSPDVAARMRSLRPDTIFAEVPDRAHVPWLDEPESLSVLRRWIAAIQG